MRHKGARRACHKEECRAGNATGETHGKDSSSNAESIEEINSDDIADIVLRCMENNDLLAKPTSNPINLVDLVVVG